MKHATTNQLAALFFGHVTAATRRIAKLFALGLLAVHCLDLNAPNLITLTPRGEKHLVGRGAARSELHVARRVDRIDEHLRVVNDLRVGLVLAARTRSDLSLDLYLADHDLRRTLGRAARTAEYIPDALVRLVLATGRVLHLVVEVDLGTEWRAHLVAKVRTVHELAGQHAPAYGLAFPWRPLVLAPTYTRARAIARLIGEEHGGDFWALGLIEGVTNDPFGATYALARDLVADGDADPFRRRLVPPPEEVK
ncbi:MAG: replication-relaxation family protein [Sandaracinus sp.]|nr:replication-relaxation family protein [Sandaracinus sp.]